MHYNFNLLQETTLINKETQESKKITLESLQRLIKKYPERINKCFIQTEFETAYDILLFSIQHNIKIQIKNKPTRLTPLKKNKILEAKTLLLYALTPAQRKHARENLAYRLFCRIPCEYQSVAVAIEKNGLANISDISEVERLIE